MNEPDGILAGKVNEYREVRIMNDYIVRATAADSSIRAFAITSKNMVQEARDHHDTSPVITAALGRLLSGAAMMGSMMKGQIECSGPARGLTVTADSTGHVKGFPKEPAVDLPPNAQGKLDVGGALDLGVMSVIKDLGMKEPYVGQTVLQTGEIAEDLTYYFATSEQIPSAVGLGVLVERDGTVKQAGGFIIQLMPFTPDEVIDKLEKKISEIKSVTEMLEDGDTPEQILENVLGEFGLEITDTMPTAFRCDCSKERVSRALATLNRKDMDDLINDNEPIEVKCQFCNQAYKFTVEDLKALRR